MPKDRFYFAIRSDIPSKISFLFFETCIRRHIVFLNEMRWWRHQIETFSALLALCERNPLVTGGFPSHSQWRGALMFSLICAWTNGWANNQGAGDLRGHRDALWGGGYLLDMLIAAYICFMYTWFIGLINLLIHLFIHRYLYLSCNSPYNIKNML